MTTSFAAQVDAWTRETKARMTAVFRESAEDVKEAMQEPVGAGGNMPVDTGFLRASLVGSTNTMPAIRPDAHPPDDAAKGSFRESGQVSLVIAGAEIGDTIYLGYTAAYARPVEYGGENRPGRGFVRLAAQRWQSIVAAVIVRLRGA